METAIFDEVARSLTDVAGDKLRRQIAATNKVQRLDRWREINLYAMRGGSSCRDPANKFRRRGELELARLTLRAGGQRYTCRVYAVSGHVFSLAIKPSIKPHAFADDLEILECNLVTDPEAPGEPVRAPALFPASYRRLLSESSDRDVKGWGILDPDDAYTITIDGDSYLVLAIREGVEFLLTLDGKHEEEIYRASVGEELRGLGSDFEHALHAE